MMDTKLSFIITTCPNKINFFNILPKNEVLSKPYKVKKLINLAHQYLDKDLVSVKLFNIFKILENIFNNILENVEGVVNIFTTPAH